MASGVEHALFYPSENGDRKYNASSMEHWLKKFFTSGVFVGELQVTANNDMTISVAKGYTNVDGKVKVFPEGQQLQLETANATYDRIDSVVIERNDPERDVFVKVVTGGYSSNPQPLTPTRENGIYQMVIAQISVAHGAVRITQADIKDTRADTTLCGIVAGAVKEMDFGQFQAQFDSYMENYKVAIANKFREYLDEIQKLQGNFESNFTKWFDEIKAQLTTDAAGHLQGQIGLLTDLTTKAKNNLVAAINEVNSKEVEVVDPMTAEEPGTAADAKLTGDALKELNAKMVIFPDYSRQKVIQNDYLVEENGYIFFTIAKPQNNNAFGFNISVNEILIYSINFDSTDINWFNISTYAFFVSKNDIVKYTITNGNVEVRFIPFKS